MKTNVSTKVEKINLKTILANYREPSFWNKKWTIINTKQLTIVWYIKGINTLRGTIDSELEATKNIVKDVDGSIVKDRWWTTATACLSSIPYNNPEYTEDHFKNNLYSNIVWLLKEIEQHYIFYYDDYCSAEDQYEKLKETLREEAEQYVDNKGIDDSIRNDVIDTYIDKKLEDEPLSRYAISVMNHYQYHVMPNMFKYVAWWFDKQEELDRYDEMDMTFKGPHTKEVIF